MKVVMKIDMNVIMKVDMKIDIKNIIKESFEQKNIDKSDKVLPSHIKKAIEILYPTFSDKLIAKCDFFVQNKSTSKCDISFEYDIINLYQINRAYKFGEGSPETVSYAYGLIMRFC
jgi:hypothetical protein